MGAQPPRHALPRAYVTSLIRHKARQLIRKPGFSSSDEEDIAQDLTLALLQKAGKYDSTRGASLDTFADRVIASEVKMLLRARRRKKRAAGFKAASLDVAVSQPDGSESSLASVVGEADRQRLTGNTGSVADPELPAVIEHALAPLPQSVVLIAKRLQHGTVNSVAKELRISRRQVYGATEQIRRRFIEAGLAP